jgi:hypothetical protein
MSEFKAERFTKAQLLEALAHAGQPMPKATAKPKLVIGFYNLKRGPQATARRFLVEQEADAGESNVTPISQASGTTTPTNGESYGETPPNLPSGKLWVLLRDTKRGMHGADVQVKGDTVTFTKENGTEVEFTVADVEAASGPSKFIKALAS